MAGKITKRHHIVAEFYLRRFANDAGQVTTVHTDKLDQRYTTSVSNAGVEGYFYGIATEEGWDTTIEDTLSKLEAEAAIDIEKLASGRSSTLPALRTRFSFFLAVQFVRGRSPRQAMVEFHKDAYLKIAQLSTPRIIKAALERQGDTITLEEAAEIAAVGHDPTLRVEFPKIGPKGLPADSLVNAPDVFDHAKELIPFFFKRGWIIVEFDQPLLLTSDEPVASGVDSRDLLRPAGLANADSVVFALDPRHALVMMRPDLLDTQHAWQRGTADQATAINRLVAFRAHKQIFFHPDTDWNSPDSVDSQAMQLVG